MEQLLVAAGARGAAGGAQLVLGVLSSCRAPGDTARLWASHPHTVRLLSVVMAAGGCWILGWLFVGLRWSTEAVSHW